MDEYEKILPPDDSIGGEDLRGVRGYASRVDPLTSGEPVAKTLTPSDERLEEVEKAVNKAKRWF
jgi:hypothetical protein